MIFLILAALCQHNISYVPHDTAQDQEKSCSLFGFFWEQLFARVIIRDNIGNIVPILFMIYAVLNRHEHIDKTLLMIKNILNIWNITYSVDWWQGWQ